MLLLVFSIRSYHINHHFPILVNDNNSYLLCKIKDGKMALSGSDSRK